MKRSDQIKSALREKVGKAKDSLFVSTGSTLLNLACTGRPDAGFMAGHYYQFCGDSDSGKTFLCMTCFAEACKCPAFDKYRLIYDGTEGGCLMDIPRFFGQRTADRVEPPAGGDGGLPRYSQTDREFYYNVDDALKVGQPFIYVLDSQDCLSSEQEINKFDERKKAYRKGKDEKVAGTYGDGKAKTHSGELRRLIGPLEETGSILIVINQTRDSFSMFEKGCYSGGRALKFYATLQLWSSQVGKIKRTVRGKQRQLGVSCKVRVKKNRVTGRDRSVVIDILHSAGIDEVGSCINFLVEESVWRKGSGGMKITGLGPEFTSGRDELIAKIEEENLEDDLRELVAATWDEIEAACAVERKRRYE